VPQDGYSVHRARNDSALEAGIAWVIRHGDYISGSSVPRLAGKLQHVPSLG